MLERSEYAALLDVAFLGLSSRRRPVSPITTPARRQAAGEGRGGRDPLATPVPARGTVGMDEGQAVGSPPVTPGQGGIARSPGGLFTQWHSVKHIWQILH